MKLELVTVTTKYSSTQEGAVSRPGGGGRIKDGVVKNDFNGSSLCGSTPRVRGWRFHERFSNSGTGTVLPRTVVGRRLWDEERRLVDHPFELEMM